MTPPALVDSSPAVRMMNLNPLKRGGGIRLRHWSFEVNIDDLVGAGGGDVLFLRRIREHYPINDTVCLVR